MKRLALCLIACAAAAGCGKSLVPGNAYDQHLLTFNGKIFPIGGLAGAEHPIVSLLWTDPYQKKLDTPMPADWIRPTMIPAPDGDVTTADAYTLDVFRPPPPEALVDVPLDSDPNDVARLAIAEIVLVDDDDKDGTFQVTGPRADIVGTDRFLGGSHFVVTYVERPYAAKKAASPLTVEGQVGYQLVSYDCEGRISNGTTPFGPTGVDLVAQRSTWFPEVRNCRRTHSP